MTISTIFNPTRYYKKEELYTRNEIDIQNSELVSKMISKHGQYIYLHEAITTKDSVGDIRCKTNVKGQITTEICEVDSVIKGDGVWRDVSRTVARNQTSFETSFSFTPQSPIVIGTTPVDITPRFGTGTISFQNEDLIYYDGGVIKFRDTTTEYMSVNIVIRISGAISGGTGSSSQYRFYIARPNGVQGTLPSDRFIKIQGSSNTISNAQVMNIRVRVFEGGNDAFQTEGFKIFAVKETGNDLSLSTTAQQTLLITR